MIGQVRVWVDCFCYQIVNNVLPNVCLSVYLPYLLGHGDGGVMPVEYVE